MCVSLDNESVLMAADLLSQRYTQNRHVPPEDDWPPYHPKHYTPLTMITHSCKCTEIEIITVAQEMIKRKENIYGWQNSSKNVSDIFIPFEENPTNPYKILIQGVPGIGKTVLSKEIAIQWANKVILQSKQLLFLLFLHDPQIKMITNTKLLVNHFCESDTLSSKITDWLIETEGKYLTILLDGYDAVTKENQSYFLSDIINRKKLTQCGVVITSHPAASSHLQNTVDKRVEIIGFAKEEQLSFLMNSLQNQSCESNSCEDFLQYNSLISDFCYVPLNMSILCCLTEGGISSLPKTQTKICEKFFMITIVHFLKKEKVLIGSVSCLNDLPHLYDKMVRDLSEFAFILLQKNRLVCTLTEVKKMCPQFNPSKWNELGLVKLARYFTPKDGCDHESIHFLHVAIQEYLAAYHIASLPDNVLLNLLIKYFWQAHYFNTWMMYVGITGGNSFTFTHFLSGNYFEMSSRLFGTSKLSSTFLSDKIKCLYLLHCLREADPQHEMLPSLEAIFQGRIIDLSNQSLSHNDIHMLAVILLRSPSKHWEKLNLSYCNIDDDSCGVLYKMFHSCDATLKITIVDISHNFIHWESIANLCNVLKCWQTEELILSVDTLYDVATMKVINTFTGKLRKAIQTSFIANILDETLLLTYVADKDMMIAVYFDKTFLKCVQFTNCKLSDHTIELLKAHAGELGMAGISNIYFILYRAMNAHYTNKLSVLFSVLRTIQIKGINMHSKGVYLLFSKICFHYTYQHKMVADYLSASVCHNIQSQSSYLSAISTLHSENVTRNLTNISKLMVLNISNNNISSEGANDIAVILKNSPNLQELYLSGNNFKTSGAIIIAEALQGISSITVFNISNNKMGDDGADAIATVLAQSVELCVLSVDGNDLTAVGAINIARALMNTFGLTVLNFSNNNISQDAASDIASVLSQNPKLKMLGLSGNNLQTAGIIKLMRALLQTKNLMLLNISNNNVCAKAADDIASVLSINPKLRMLG